MWTRAAWTTPLLLLAACASQTPAYKVGGLPEGWRKIGVGGGDLAYKHSSGGTIFANRMCKGVDDVPLDVLTNHLFFDLRVVQEISRQEISIDGRAGLRTHVLAELDGVPIELDVVVVKKDGCTYDMALVAGPEVFDQRRADFESFLEGFEKVG